MHSTLRIPNTFLLTAILVLICCLTWACFSRLQAAEPPANSGKFDVYLLVGQSNMAGRGAVGPEDRKSDPRILIFNAQNEWASQGEPIHFDKPTAGVGLGFAFAKQMADKHPGVTIGLIPCAVGGTQIALWKPGAVLFEKAVERTKLALKNGGVLKGILWHQGEANSGSAESAAAYGHDLTQVIEGFRKSLNAPGVPFIVGELGEYLYPPENPKHPFSREVNAQINSVPKLVPNTAVVPAKGLTPNKDILHFDTPSLKEFGKRYFEAFQRLTEKQTK